MTTPPPLLQLRFHADARLEKRIVLVMLVLVQALPFVELSMRGYRGQSFLGDAGWWICLVLFLSLPLVVFGWMLKAPQRWWVAGMSAFAMTLVGSGVVATASARMRFDILRAWVLNPYFPGETNPPGCSWVDLWVAQGDIVVGVLAWLATTCLLGALRRNLLQPSLQGVLNLMQGFGVALLCLSPLAFWQEFACGSGRPTGTGRLVRDGMWSSLAVFGLLSLSAGLYFYLQRRSWLRRIAAGRVNELSCREAVANDPELVLHSELCAEPSWVVYETGSKFVLGRVPPPRRLLRVSND